MKVYTHPKFVIEKDVRIPPMNPRRQGLHSLMILSFSLCRDFHLNHLPTVLSTLGLFSKLGSSF